MYCTMCVLHICQNEITSRCTESMFYVNVSLIQDDQKMMDGDTHVWPSFHPIGLIYLKYLKLTLSLTCRVYRNADEL